MKRFFFALMLGVTLLTAGSAYAATGSAAYTYDALGRLTQISYDNGTTITFTYDAVGNRNSRVTTLGP